MKQNTKPSKVNIYTHEGGKATPTPNAAVALRRAVMACLLWEDAFYESGKTIADRIKELVPQVPPEVVAHFAIKAREDMKLRHIPLLLVREMARGPAPHRRLVAQTLFEVIRRADEIAEFLAIYWKDGREKLSAQVKKGLAKSFTKFNEYSLGKYKSNKSEVSLRDVLFMVHGRTKDTLENTTLKSFKVAPLDKTTIDRAGKTHNYKRGEVLRHINSLAGKLVVEALATPDTHEVTFSNLGNVDDATKRGEWERLIVDDKLGALALLRNLRRMEEVKVDRNLIKMALEKMDTKWVLPHRFIAAARFAPSLEQFLEPKMFECVQHLPKIKERTTILIDVSGSMDYQLSGKSDMTRLDAACGLAMIAREICEDVNICTFSDNVVHVAARRGFALRDLIFKSQPHNGTRLGGAINTLNNNLDYDRIIVITDEQAHDDVGIPKGIGYMINVASYENGVGYGTWNKIDGFSESVLRYIAEYEQGDL